MKDMNRRVFLTSTTVAGSTLIAGCSTRLPFYNDGDDNDEGEDHHTELGVEPVVETTSQHAADWRNTAWVSGKVIEHSPEEVWRRSVEEYGGIEKKGTATTNEAYFFTNRQEIISVDTTTGEQLTSHTIGIHENTTPITHRNRVFVTGTLGAPEIMESDVNNDFSGMITMMGTSMEDRTWSSYTNTHLTTDIATYSSQVHVGTENGLLHCYNHLHGRKEWDALISEDNPIVRAPAIDDDYVYVVTIKDLVCLDRASGSTEWSVGFNTDITTNPVSFGPYILLITEERVFVFENDTGNEVSRITRTNTGSNVFATASNDTLITYQPSGTETEINGYDVQSGSKLWDTKTTGTVSSQPIVSNVVSYIPKGNKLAAFNTITNEIEWEYQTPSEITHHPIVTPDNILLQTESELIAIN